MTTMTGCERTRRTTWLVVSLVAGSVSVAGCNRVIPVSHEAAATAMVGAHGFAPAFLARCGEMGWTPTCDDALYTDDQQFILDDGQYGPHSYVAPAPDLGSWTESTAFTTPRLVAMAYVKPEQVGPGGLPAPYTALRLSAGSNCIYLQYADTSFTAYVEPANAPCATAYVPNAARALPVVAIRNPPPWNSGSNQEQSDNIPAVARFHEAHNLGNSHYTMVGVRCGDRWCLIRPQEQVTEESSAHQGMHQDRRGWSIKGWSDQQHLALANASGVLLPSRLHAAILPDDNLKSNTFAPPSGRYPGDAQHVATIVFRGKPEGVYKDKWYLRNGVNDLYVWKDSTGAWQGEIQNKSWWGLVTNHIAVRVDRRHAGSNPPATARFRWSAMDEDLWVACDGGCCYVNTFN